MHKKDITLIFLLLLAAMPQLFSVCSLIEKKIIEYSMVKRLEQENLQTVTIDAASVIWLKKDKEILINGEPFDIKTIIRNGNKIVVSGLFDIREKELKQKLQAYQQEEGKSASTNNSLLLLIFTTWYQVNEPINFTLSFLIHKRQAWQKYQDKIGSLSHEIITPPPRLL